jgi:hypothetical protein
MTGGTNRASFPTLSIIEQHPIKHTIFLLSDVLQNFGKKLTKEVVVWVLLEAEFANIVQVDAKFLCAQYIRCAHCKAKGHEPGKPSESSLIAVVCFFSPIFSYFCLFVAALSPCQGSPPRRKYMKTCPRPSRSSRRDCSFSNKMSERPFQAPP